MNAHRQGGFNLLELMVTVMVVGVVLGLGVPNFMEFQRNNAITALANDFVSAIYLARTEAVKRQVPVTLCASANATTPAPTCGGAGPLGFIVFVDDANPAVVAATDGNATVDAGELVLSQHPAPTGTITVFADGLYIAYGTSGFVVPTAPGQAQPGLTNILLCDDRGNADSGGRSAARVVTVSPVGRAQIMRSQADVVAAVAITGGACP
ncbi:MAG TPA: GspH/FimT family pseudopilin [Gammaproteobacteria bacterium]|nr:GspH/FimT family pseudopilin [Gammaproteobacteria bacterium]